MALEGQWAWPSAMLLWGTTGRATPNPATVTIARAQASKPLPTLHWQQAQHSILFHMNIPTKQSAQVRRLFFLPPTQNQNARQNVHGLRKQCHLPLIAPKLAR
jgi:hypothetical protein